ncbi:MAG: hypothetical protein LAP21_26900 [Acidobacteriia bacterium]|nr:hypothetical protein [Terriglobia bacterium]
MPLAQIFSTNVAPGSCQKTVLQTGGPWGRGAFILECDRGMVASQDFDVGWLSEWQQRCGAFLSDVLEF